MCFVSVSHQSSQRGRHVNATLTFHNLVYPIGCPGRTTVVYSKATFTKLLCFMQTQLIYLVRFGLMRKIRENRHVIINQRLFTDFGEKKGPVFGTADCRIVRKRKTSALASQEKGSGIFELQDQALSLSSQGPTSHLPMHRPALVF